ncbi:unnamed protein product [Gongylonema pulchrum]|uniref:C2H2-type domain-containing protein n=1 Tax=Gongylonema pulchrum TaxID=637853 RepID=A0A183DT83_9BILA|nr:unnamed protein product [Gongylonema pulchrum]
MGLQLWIPLSFVALWSLSVSAENKTFLLPYSTAIRRSNQRTESAEADSTSAENGEFPAQNREIRRSFFTPPRAYHQLNAQEVSAALQPESSTLHNLPPLQIPETMGTMSVQFTEVRTVNDETEYLCRFNYPTAMEALALVYGWTGKRNNVAQQAHQQRNDMVLHILLQKKFNYWLKGLNLTIVVHSFNEQKVMYLNLIPRVILFLRVILFFSNITGLDYPRSQRIRVEDPGVLSSAMMEPGSSRAEVEVQPGPSTVAAPGPSTIVGVSLTNSEGKQYQCQYCDKRYKTKGMYKNHVLSIHFGQPIYLCGKAGCTQVFHTVKERDQ